MVAAFSAFIAEYVNFNALLFRLAKSKNHRYTLTFSSCASNASNSRRLGLISRGLPT